MKEEKPVNLTITDGDSFFAHELTVNFTPTQFTLDFKNITPRNDPRSKDRPSFALKHNVIMMDPYQIRAMADVLADVIKKYETAFGKVTKPKAIEIAEKMNAKKPQPKSKKPADVPSYFG